MTYIDYRVDDGFNMVSILFTTSKIILLEIAAYWWFDSTEPLLLNLSDLSSSWNNIEIIKLQLDFCLNGLYIWLRLMTEICGTRNEHFNHWWLFFIIVTGKQRDITTQMDLINRHPGLLGFLNFEEDLSVSAASALCSRFG